MRRAQLLLLTLVMVGASAACGGGSADPAGPSASSSPTHNGHGPFVPPAAAPLRVGERFVTLTMPQPYTPVAPNGGTDEYRCFLVDPKLSAQRRDVPGRAHRHYG